MEIILITGGAGFIGSNLIKFILKRKKSIQIYSLDNYSSGKSSNHINSFKVKYLKGSTLDLNKNKNLLKIKFDKVYHFAEYSRIVPSFVDYELCLKNNNFGTLEVIKFCLKNNAKLIYSASSSTIGKNKNLSPYSWSKYSSNELIKNFSKWFGLKYVIVYFYNVYGNNQILNGKMAAVIGIFEAQYKTGKPLTIVKPGTQKRDFTHVDDIVNGTYLASTKAINDEFHIGSGKNYKLVDIVKMFKSEYIYVEERPGERFYSLSNSNKAKRILNYKPKHNLKEYIKKFINKNKN